MIAPVLWAATIAIAGELSPGFDHVSQYISELGERGSPTAFLMRYAGFIATGLMHIAYAAAFLVSLARAGNPPRLTLLVAVLIAFDGIGRMGAGFFSCEPGCNGPETLAQHLHHLSATLAFLSLTAAACLGSLVFRGDQRLRSLCLYSLLSGCAGLIFLGLMSAGEATHTNVGLYERLASGMLTLWVFVTALRLRKLSL